MISVEPLYINSVPSISWYNLVIHSAYWFLFFHLQVRTASAIESAIDTNFPVTTYIL